MASEKIMACLTYAQQINLRLSNAAGSALVANVSSIRSPLHWRPQFQSLDTIVAHALAWEKFLGEFKNGRPDEGRTVGRLFK